VKGGEHPVKADRLKQPPNVPQLICPTGTKEAVVKNLVLEGADFVKGKGGSGKWR